jgi:hypothetical protein
MHMNASNKYGVAQRVALPLRNQLLLPVLICFAIQLWAMPLAFSTETASGSTLKFDHSEYMKATASGQKKAGPALKGALCFDSAQKSVSFLDKGGNPAFQIGYDSIKSMLYEQSATPRYAEAVLISPLFLLSNSKKHYLTIQYTDSDGAGQFVIIHLDKKNAQEAIAAAQSQTGKPVERVEQK